MVTTTRDPVRARVHRLPFPPYSGPPIKRWVYEVSVRDRTGTITGAHMTWEDAQREVDQLVHDPGLLLRRLSAGGYVSDIRIDPSMRPTLHALLTVRDNLRKSGNAAAADMVQDVIRRIAFPRRW